MKNERELPFRITVLRPLPGVTLRLQRGRAGLVPPTRISGERVSFDFTLRLAGAPPDPPNFRGELAQGPPAERFVYVNVGTLAGQADSCWTRRAKVMLSGISWEQIEEVSKDPEALLEARFAGAARDGGPACARVALLDGGWRIARREGD